MSFRSQAKSSDNPAYKGRQLSAELRKDGQRIRIGTVEQIVGTDFKGDVTAATLSTGKVTTGPIDITPCRVVVPDINIARMDAATAEYRDGTDLTISVKAATLTGVRIPYLDARFGDVPDGKGGMKTGLVSLTLGSGGTAAMMAVDRIEGTDFYYHGVSREPDKPVATTEVHAQKAVMGPLTVANFERHFVDNLTKVNADLTSAKLDDFSLRLTQTLGSDTESKLLLADVDGTGIRANLVLADAVANGKPWVTGESTFELDAVGLSKVQSYQTGNGKTTAVTGRHGLEEGTANLKQFKARLHPDGTAFMQFDELTGAKLKLKMDGVEAAVNLVTIKDFVLGLKGMTLDKAQQQIALHMKELSVGGLEANVRVARAADLSGATTAPAWTSIRSATWTAISPSSIRRPWRSSTRHFRSAPASSTSTMRRRLPTPTRLAPMPTASTWICRPWRGAGRSSMHRLAIPGSRRRQVLRAAASTCSRCSRPR